jgi:hypothetical protein
VLDRPASVGTVRARSICGRTFVLLGLRMMLAEDTHDVNQFRPGSARGPHQGPPGTREPLATPPPSSAKRSVDHQAPASSCPQPPQSGSHRLGGAAIGWLMLSRAKCNCSSRSSPLLAAAAAAGATPAPPRLAPFRETRSNAPPFSVVLMPLAVV